MGSKKMTRFQEYLNAQSYARGAREGLTATSDSLEITPSGDCIQVTDKDKDTRRTIILTENQMIQIYAWCEENLRDNAKSN